LKTFLSDWRTLPVAGVGLMAAVGAYYLFRPKKEDAGEVERQRRAYLNRVGRIVEGQIVEVVEHSGGAPEGNDPEGLGGSRATVVERGAQKLLGYTYAISGVTYETAQDITGLEGKLHLTRVAAGQTASVKYDPANPSNSILLADDWSGLH
jgi:uncharacterized protein DUF3592